jgi:hypothetical protein
MWYSNEPIAVVSRAKFGAFRHFGLLLPDGLVAHCAPNHGEHISTMDEFASGEDVKIERVLQIQEYAAILGRVTEATRTPKAYDALTNNCEMFVNRLLGVPPEIPQLRGIGVLIALGLLLKVAAK